MKTRMMAGAVAWALLIGVAGAIAVGIAGAPEGEQRGQAAFQSEDYRRWLEDPTLSNWGRWGEEDEIGAMNLITPEKMKQAAALVKVGASVSLAELQVPNVEDPVYTGRPYTMTLNFPDGYEERVSTEEWTAPPAENLALSAHGGRSHIDALAHNFHNGQYYNGFSYKEITETGAAKGGIHNLRHGIVTRGVLMDLPRLKGVPYLPKDEHIYVEDLEAWEKKAGIKVSSGDALFIRVGHWARRRATGDKSGGSAGLDPSVIPWLKERGVAVMGAETAHDVSPNPYTGGPGERQHRIPGDITGNPVHYFAKIYMGMHLFDFLDLDALSEMAAEHNRWEFLLVAAPLPVVGGTGSPINPIAVF